MIRQAIGRMKTATKKIARVELDCLDLLRADHMKVEAQLLQLRISRSAAHRDRLLRSIQDDLSRHMKIEEDLFYPACMNAPDLRDLVQHSYQEHQELRDLIRQLHNVDSKSTRFSRMVTQLIRKTEDHVMDEENKIFPTTRKKMNSRDFSRLNRDIIQAHGESGARPARKAA